MANISVHLSKVLVLWCSDLPKQLYRVFMVSKGFSACVNLCLVLDKHQILLISDRTCAWYCLLLYRPRVTLHSTQSIPLGPLAWHSFPGIANFIGSQQLFIVHPCCCFLIKCCAKATMDLWWQIKSSLSLSIYIYSNLKQLKGRESASLS